MLPQLQEERQHTLKILEGFGVEGGWGFRVWRLGFRVWGLGFRVWVGFEVYSEGQGDLVSRQIIPISHTITPVLLNPKP